MRRIEDNFEVGVFERRAIGGNRGGGFRFELRWLKTIRAIAVGWNVLDEEDAVAVGGTLNGFGIVFGDGGGVRCEGLGSGDHIRARPPAGIEDEKAIGIAVHAHGQERHRILLDLPARSDDPIEDRFGAEIGIVEGRAGDRVVMVIPADVFPVMANFLRG